MAGAISAATVGESKYGEPIWSVYAARNPATDNRSAGEQAGMQFLALFITWAIAIIGGEYPHHSMTDAATADVSSLALIEPVVRRPDHGLPGEQAQKLR